MSVLCKKNSFDRTTLRFPGTKTRGYLYFGAGIVDETAGKLELLTPSGTILLIVDPVFQKMEWFSTLVDSILAKGFTLELFSNVEPEPTSNSIEKIKLAVRKQKISAIVGIGGGSTLDSAKFASILGNSTHSAKDLIYTQELICQGLPLLLIPTTAGTGSELSPYIVVSDNGRKLFITSEHAYADIALVDPMLTCTMPDKLTAFTGLDALSHAVEGVVGNDNPYTRALAKESVRLIFTNLPKAVKDGEDIEARANMSFASILGMLTYMQGGGLYAHSMSYVLTETHCFPHGLGCGIALPYTMKFNEPSILPILDELGGVINSRHRVPATEVAKEFLKLVASVGVPSSLKEAGIDESELPIFSEALVSKYPRPRNPRSLTLGLSSSLVQAMFEHTL